MTTGIQWTDETWHPWKGCHHVSEGCANCYAMRPEFSRGRSPGTVERSLAKDFTKPVRWRRTLKVFVCSLSDFFHTDADAWRREAWEIMRTTPHIYQITTKRIERAAGCLPEDWGASWPNVWLGVSVENQRRADERIPILLSIPAAIRWVSCEPLLESIDLSAYVDQLDWIVTGGESARHNPRRAELDWFREVRDLCLETGTAYFHKQHGGARKFGDAYGGRELDGRTWDQFPILYEQPLLFC